MDQPFVDAFRNVFPAEITGVSLIGGYATHAWKEKRFDPASGGYVDAVPGRSGDASTAPAYELRNSALAIGDMVWLRFRGVDATGRPTFETILPMLTSGGGTLAGTPPNFIVNPPTGTGTFGLSASIPTAGLWQIIAVVDWSFTPNDFSTDALIFDLWDATFPQLLDSDGWHGPLENVATTGRAIMTSVYNTAVPTTLEVRVTLGGSPAAASALDGYISFFGGAHGAGPAVVTPADGSVSTIKIVDGAVTGPKLADGAVNLAKLGPDVLSRMWLGV